MKTHGAQELWSRAIENYKTQAVGTDFLKLVINQTVWPHRPGSLHWLIDDNENVP